MLILRKVCASQKDRDGCFYSSHRQRVRSRYYIAPYYNVRSEDSGRFKWQKTRRTREEAWSMDGSLRFITATIRCDRGNAVATVWKFFLNPYGRLQFFLAPLRPLNPSGIIHNRVRAKISLPPPPNVGFTRFTYRTKFRSCQTFSLDERIKFRVKLMYFLYVMFFLLSSLCLVSLAVLFSYSIDVY